MNPLHILFGQNARITDYFNMAAINCFPFKYSFYLKISIVEKKSDDQKKIWCILRRLRDGTENKRKDNKNSGTIWRVCWTSELDLQFKRSLLFPRKIKCNDSMKSRRTLWCPCLYHVNNNMWHCHYELYS